MNGLFKVAEQMLIDQILKNSFPLTGKSKAGLALMAFSGFAFIISAGFFIYAGHIWFSKNFPAETATALTGLVLFAISLICGLGAHSILTYNKLKVQKAQDELANTVLSIMEVANDEIAEPVRENPKTALLAASCAGLIAGKRFL